MKNHVTRRGVLTALTASTAAACSSQTSESFKSKNIPATGTFNYGIASGDPTSDAVILWTRVTPDDESAGPIEVACEMLPVNGTADPDFDNLSFQKSVTASAATNWTAKIDATGLKSGTWYYYRFRLGDNISPVGKTRTLPEGKVDELSFAVVSCANWQHGLFNVYDHISKQDHFDAMFHLGDYYYEYGADGYADTAAGKLGRLHEPRHEIVSLTDYRMRHAQYRTDPGLQAATANMPLICIWDDHETSNDSWATGAQNHQPNEGDWEVRKTAAMRAYYEWMPIREPRPGRAREDIFRSYEWGDLLTLVSLETRLVARGEPIIVDDYFDQFTSQESVDKFLKDTLADPERDMLGRVQTDFVAKTLSDSKAAGKPWRVLANQVIMGRLNTPDMNPYVDETAIANIEKDWVAARAFVEASKYGLPVYLDSWDGYPAAREKFFTRLKSEGVEDILVLTGDAHEYWVNDLTTDAGDKVGMELVTTSVSSETLGKYMGDTVRDYALLMTQNNENAKYYNAEFNGYIDMKFTRKKALARFVAVNGVLSNEYESFETARFTIRPSKNTIKATSPKGLNFKQRLLFSGFG